DHANIGVIARNGTARLETADLTRGKNELHLRGTVDLPRRFEDFGRTTTAIEVAATAPDLAEITADMPQKISGSARVTGKIDIHESKVNGQFSVVAGALGSADGTIERINAEMNLTKTVSPPESKKPWFADLRSDTTVNATNIRVRDFAFDSMDAVIHNVDDLVTFERALVRRGQNEFSLTGEYRLPPDLHRADTQPAKVDVVLNAPQLAEYWFNESADRIYGPLQINGQIEWRNGVANGQLSVFGADLRFRDMMIHQVSSQCAISENVVYLNDFAASLNQQDTISANGIADLRAPHRYRGSLLANIVDLSVLNPLMRASGNENSIGGTLVVDWQGDGEIRSSNNSGKLKLKLDKGRYGDQLKALQANIDASYSRDGFDAPIIFFRSDKMDFQAVAQTRGERLEINKIQLNQGTLKYADGYVSIPFVWKNIGTDKSPLPADGTVSATFQTENLDIKKVFEDVGMKPPASGTANVKFEAGGTLSQLNANLVVQMRQLRTDNIPKLEPASVDLSAEARDGRVTITGNVQQPKIQPITLNANFPFPVREMVKQRKMPDNTPITAQVRMPRSSVNFMRQFIPEVEELDGDLAFDVDIKGTIAEPVLSGSGDVTINVGRFSNPTLPPLQNFKGRLVFNRDTLNLERFGGELAGGPFSVSGRVVFPKLTQPNLEMQLKASSVLVARNDSLTARADADLSLTGPLTSATVKGNVALTNSHFLKNLDLIPIGLPGRPAPEPPVSRPQFSIPDPPVRDWKFDVALKTKDPFLIRGSLANGGARIDLHLGGTGLHPILDGQVRMENVEATLPFSRLEIQFGFLYFDPSDPLNPKLDLHGTSVIRDYTIHVFVYGRSLSPEAVFTSEPPLPQEEIISLLATGTTRQELTGNNNVLAGRAAMLLFQQLYRKVFKKGESTNSSTVFDRLDVDFGQVDPRTGQQTATARFKVNQQIVVIGDIEVGGDFRGMVKYLIRFR
ncbi:MAG TPA: translocation/assembly module TamB domain-containing protein, partial [Chthoniobacterales bacterium]